MPRILIAILTACLFLLTPHAALAEDAYTVPLTIAGASYTVTVTVEADSPAVAVGEIAVVLWLNHVRLIKW